MIEEESLSLMSQTSHNDRSNPDEENGILMPSKSSQGRLEVSLVELTIDERVNSYQDNK